MITLDNFLGFDRDHVLPTDHDHPDLPAPKVSSRDRRTTLPLGFWRQELLGLREDDILLLVHADEGSDKGTVVADLDSKGSV